MADGTVHNEINTITIKVPPFFKHAPETLFVHLEAQFNLKQLKVSSTKLYWCISALLSDVTPQLMHMIRDLGEDPYQEIKDCLIHLYSLSNYQKFEALVYLPFTSDTTLCPHELHAAFVPQEVQTRFRLHWIIPLPFTPAHLRPSPSSGPGRKP